MHEEVVDTVEVEVAGNDYLVGGHLVLKIQTHCELCLVGRVGSSGVLGDRQVVVAD